MEIIQIKRVFKYNDLTLTDPDENKSPNQVLDHFANIYPALSIAKVESKGIEDDQDVYEFNVNVGTKG
jgi:PRTRC genetic system protein C